VSIWQKIGLITGVIIAMGGAVFACAVWLINTGAVQSQIKNNANEVPAIRKDFRDHVESDNINYVNFLNAINNLSSQVTLLREDIKENTRTRNYEKFEYRK